MKPAHFEGETRVLGEKQGYRPLPVHEEVITDAVTGDKTPVITSLWKPSPEEVAIIAGGGSIQISICGYAMPPIMVTATPVVAIEVEG